MISDTPNRSLAIPEPGVDLVPDGWWKSTVMPWADATDNPKEIRTSAAQLDALIAAYETLDADTLELMRARRYLEIRWGELLGSGEDAMKAGVQDPSHAREGLDRNARHRFRLLASMRTLVLERLEDATDADEVTRAALLKIAHVGQSTGENEWYTPSEIIDAAAEVMGGIDLDPASSLAANKTVNAAKFYTKEDNGLDVQWKGRVWLNPPYVSDLVARFTEKLCAEYLADNISEAVLLVNNATETVWFQHTAAVANAVCFHAGRISYWYPERPSKTPLQGQAILYFGANTDKFNLVFRKLGIVFP